MYTITDKVIIKKKITLLHLYVLHAKTNKYIIKLVSVIFIKVELPIFFRLLMICYFIIILNFVWF